MCECSSALLSGSGSVSGSGSGSGSGHDSLLQSGDDVLDKVEKKSKSIDVHPEKSIRTEQNRTEQNNNVHLMHVGNSFELARS